MHCFVAFQYFESQINIWWFINNLVILISEESCRFFLEKIFFRSPWLQLHFKTEEAPFNQIFLRCFRDVRIENRVLRIRENYHRVSRSRIRANWVPMIRKIGSLQVHTRYLTVSLKEGSGYSYACGSWNLKTS